MKRFGKLLLGALTVLPLGYLVYFFSTWFGAQPPFADMQLFMAVHMGACFSTMFLTFGFVAHALTREDMDKSQRLLWGLLLFVGNMLANPIYWYLKIWKEPNDTLAA